MDKVIKVLIWVSIFCLISFSIYWILAHGFHV